MCAYVGPMAHISMQCTYGQVYVCVCACVRVTVSRCRCQLDKQPIDGAAVQASQLFHFLFPLHSHSAAGEQYLRFDTALYAELGAWQVGGGQ